MSVIAIIHPTGLLGQEIRDLLGRQPESWSEVRLLSSDETQVGALTDIGGSAAIVVKLEAESLRDVEVAFLCGDAEATAPVIDQLDPGTLAVIANSGAGVSEKGLAVVHGVNSSNLAEATDRLLLSPHPGVILLAHLVEPLRHLGLTHCCATLVMPASVADKRGMDELFSQTRSIVAMVEEREQAVFGRQLAFNLYPDSLPPGLLTAQLRTLFADGPVIVAQTIQGGIFHGVSASVHLTFAEDPGLAAFQEALAASSALELHHGDLTASTIDGAASEAIVVGEPRSDGNGGYWLWAVMDNLVGGAGNAVGVARAAIGK